MSKHPFQIAIEEDDTEGYLKLLAPDVVFHSPIVHKPFIGRELVAALLPLLRACFTDVVYTADLVGNGVHAGLCSVKIAGLDGENMQVLRFDDEGRIVDITVLLRPLRASMALAEMMGPHARQLPDGSYELNARPPSRLGR